ncbi:DrmB family protein [Cetobacterium sp.]|uniref:DrmB family protein n=1 Tax=Cetobacterium sp. TaxID=2071632 RepID=UPI003F2EE278
MAWNKTLGKLTPYQLITTFGPGALIDGVTDSLMPLDCKYWPSKNKKIYDKRLTEYLGVGYFRTPEDVPVNIFPDFHKCKKCHKLFRVSKINKESYQLNGARCICGGESHPVRFIVMCENGHIQDFPWSGWVHDGNDNCKSENLKLISSGVTSSLADLKVVCNDCGAKKSLSGVSLENSLSNFECDGYHPHRLEKDLIKCTSKVKFSYKGSTNTYFSNTVSALLIPSCKNPLNLRLEKHIEEIQKIKSSVEVPASIKIYNSNITLDTYIYNSLKLDIFDKYFSDFSEDEFFNILNSTDENKVTRQDLKRQEYDAILNYRKFEKDSFFKAIDENPEELKKYFSKIIRVEKLKELIVLKGFNRVKMPDYGEDNISNLVELNSGKDKWLPAVEAFGEGIFLEFNRKTLDRWNEILEVSKKGNLYNSIYSAYLKSKDWEKREDRDANYLLIHTLSHLLIKKLGDVSGYTSTSIRERIYYGKDMNGVLIYTSTSDTEGSLGGLVEQGKKENLKSLLLLALKDALTCNSDPICVSTNPVLENLKFNGASCHSCTLVSETSCEIGNKFLDRRFLLSLEGEKMGYFDEYFQNEVGIKLY